MSTKYEIITGASFDKDGSPISPQSAESRLRFVKLQASTVVDGFTIHRTEGGWRDQSGKFVADNGYCITILGEDDDKTRNAVFTLAEFVKFTFGQECVVFSATPCNACLV